MNSKTVSRWFRATCLVGTFCCVTFTQSLVCLGEEDPAPSVMQRIGSGMNPMNWKMPDWGSILPTQDEKSRVENKKESLVDEISATASRSWTKAKEVLNPAKYNPMKMFSGPSRSPSSRASAGKPQQKEKGFWGSLFAPKSSPEPITDVNDFLRQSKPRL